MTDLPGPADNIASPADKPHMRTFSVSDCDVCGNSGENLYDKLEDHWGIVPGLYAMRQCTNPGCRSVWLCPRPIEEDIGLAYETYYTHVAPDADKKINRNLVILRYLHDRWMALFGLVRQQQNLECMGLRKRAPGKVLDIGCGNGGRLAKLKALGWSVQGQEIDSVSAAIASEMLSCPVFVGPLKDARYADSTFDAVISNHVIEHVHDAEALLAEAHRILKPGGLLTVVTPNASSLGHWVFRQHWMGLDPPRHLSIFTPQSYGALAAQAGVRDFKIRTTAARAEAFVIGSLTVRNNRRGRVRPRHSPGAMARIAGGLCAPIALLYWAWNPDSGEECTLWAQKPEG